MSYAVVWSEDGGPLFAGRLDLVANALRLDGRGDEAYDSERALAYDEIADVQFERGLQARLGGRPTLVLTRRNGSYLRVASVGGAGFLREIADSIEAALGESTGGRDGSRRESRPATPAAPAMTAD